VGLLDGCYLKIARSQEHLDDLNQSRQRLIEREGQLVFAFTGKANSQRTKYVFRVDEVLTDLPFLEWGVMVGDAAHCLRSALDQMVYTLAADPTQVCAFPILATAKEWAVEAPGMLWSVPDDVRALIETYQPYHGGDKAHSHPLALLRGLSNLDKHRGIPTTALSSIEATRQITKTFGIRSYKAINFKTGVALEPNAVVADVSFETDDSGEEPYMHMDGHFVFDVAFGRGPIPSSLYLKPIVQTFNEIGGCVFTLMRTVSDIVEPDAARPDSVGGPDVFRY
jgi:hypothetical protein